MYNFIDKQFQDMLWPLHVVSDIMLLPNFNMRDGYVTANSRVQNFKAFLLTIGLITIAYFRFKKSFVLDNDIDLSFSFTMIGVYFDFLYYSSSFIFFFISNAFNSTNYVSLVLSLQRALRNLRCKENVNNIMNSLTFGNRASMISIPAYYVFCFVTNGVFTLGAVLNFIPLLYFDVSVICTIRMIYIIKDELTIWVDELSSNVEQLKTNEDVEINEKILFSSYRYILDAYQFFMKVSKVPVCMSHIIFYGIMKVELNCT